MHSTPLESLEADVARLGVVLASDGAANDAAGILNPGVARSRDGKLLLYPRMVAEGNISRIGIFEDRPGAVPRYARVGYALEPSEPYELRNKPGGHGCEDPRVTFVPSLDSYVMTYTAFGPEGPRIAIALSRDGYAWRRLGPVDFSAPGLPSGDDKDAAFFPEPVLSPAGVLSYAFYHRPMLHVSTLDGCAALPIILDLPPADRESTRIAYVPLDAVQRDLSNLLKVAESVLVLEPGRGWGAIKNGAGTPPVRIEEGWFSLFHGVDGAYDELGRCVGMRYSAGFMVHDLERPDIVRFRSPAPVLSPQTDDERLGIVKDVVFPTGIDLHSSDAKRSFDVYYGMADSRIGCARIDLKESVLAEPEESAA